MNYKIFGVILVSMVILAIPVQAALEEDTDYPIAPDDTTVEPKISAGEYEVKLSGELLKRLNQIDNRITTLNHTLLYNALTYFDQLSNKNFEYFDDKLYAYLNVLTIRMIAGLIGAIFLAVGIVEIVKRRMSHKKKMSLYTERHETPPPQAPPAPEPEQPTIEGIIKILKGETDAR